MRFHRNVIRGNTIGLELLNAEDSRIEDNLIELNPHGGTLVLDNSATAICLTTTGAQLAR